ncbi:MAG: hypothetical protein LBC14_03990 [Desulfovibrio sp.]|nr:hypothetical protein [Desulfovibrio sp.]
MNRHTRRHIKYPIAVAPADTMYRLAPANRCTPAFACAVISGFAAALFSLVLLRGLL